MYLQVPYYAIPYHITSYHLIHFDTSSHNVGMDGFMHKPFKLSTLIHVIGDISNRRKQVQPYTLSLFETIFLQLANLIDFALDISLSPLYTPVLQILLQTQTNALPPHDSSIAVPVVDDFVSVPTDSSNNNDDKAFMIPKVVGNNSIDCTTIDGDSKSGNGNGTISGIKLAPLSSSGSGLQ